MRKVFLSTLIYALVLGAIFGIVVILLGVWNDLTLKVLLVTGTIFGYSIPGLLCSSLYDKKDYQTVASVGMVTCFISCIYLVINIITDFRFFGNDEELVVKSILILTLLAWSIGHISGLLMSKTGNKTILNVRDLTIVLSIMIDVLWIFRLLIENDDHMKIDAILAILISLGTIVVPIANKIVSKNTLNVSSEENEVEVKEENNEEAKPVVQTQVVEQPQEIIRNTEPDNNILGEINNSNTNKEDKYDKIEKLKKLLDSNAITQEEYDLEKKKILENE